VAKTLPSSFAAGPDADSMTKFLAACSITTSASFVGTEYCQLDKNFYDESWGAASKGKGARAIWFIGAFVDQEWYTS